MPCRCSCAHTRAGRTGRQASRPQSTGPARRVTTVTVTPLDGATVPTRPPHHLAGDGMVPYPARGRVVLSVRWSGGIVRAHYLALDGRARPAKTPGCTAVSARLL